MWQLAGTLDMHIRNGSLHNNCESRAECAYVGLARRMPDTTAEPRRISALHHNLRSAAGEVRALV